MPVRSFLRRSVNFGLHWLARNLPGKRRVRPTLHRLRGVRVGRDVIIADDVYIDGAFPERVVLEDRVLIAPRASIFAHGRGVGFVVMERDSRLGACATICCSGGRSIRVGEGAVIAPGAMVVKDVPAHTVVAGVPARVIGRAKIPLGIDTPIERWREGFERSTDSD